MKKGRAYRTFVWMLIASLLLTFMFVAGVKPAAASWTQDWDFTASDGGWLVDNTGIQNECGGGSAQGVYDGANGWKSDFFSGNPDLCFHSGTFASSTVNTFDVYWSNTYAVNGGSADILLQNASSWTLIAAPTTGVAGSHHDTYSGTWAADTVVIKIILNCGGCGTDSLHITRIVLTGSGSAPFPTSTPSPTPTFTPTPTGTIPAPAEGGNLGKLCQILGLPNSAFLNPPATWTLNGIIVGGQTIIPDMPGTGLVLSGGAASLPLTLDPANKYMVSLHYRIINTITVEDSFSVQLGASSAQPVVISTSLTEQTYEGPSQNFEPTLDTGGGKEFDFVLSKELTDPDPGLIIDWACVSLVNTNGAGEVGAGAGAVITANCKTCAYRPVGDLFKDIPALFEWLICFIGQLWDCTIKVIASGIWQRIVDMLALIGFIRVWIGMAISAASDWLNGNLNVVRAWIGGNIINIITSIFNALLRVLAQLGILDFLNNLVRLLASAPATIIDFGTAVISFLGTVVQIISTIAAIALDWISRAFNLALNLLGVVPQLIASIAAGFNQTNTIPAWAANCTNSNTFLYYPCLGMYVLDNTVFDGPGFLLIPVVMGFVGFNVVLWSMKKIKDVMERS